MKRKTKNIICSFLILILLCSIGLTIYIAKNNLSTNSTNEKILENNNINQSNDNTNMENPPEKPDEENSSTDSNKENSSNNNETPPEKPDGENNNDSNSNKEEPPEKPDGENNNNSNDSMKEMPSNNGSNQQMPDNMNNNNSLTTVYYLIIGFESLLLNLIIIYLIQSKFNKKTFKETYLEKDKILILILSTIITASILTFGVSYLTNNYILTNNSNNEKQENMSNSNITYSASNEITTSENISNKEYTSETKDENALSVSGDIEVTLDDITVTKEGDSDGGDNTSFYGTNSAIIAKDGATLNITNANITTNASGANGVFSYGGSATTNNSSSDGTTINISDSTITTTKDNSGGIMTTGGGTTNAKNLTIKTSGTSSAAIRSDRGGGTVTVDGGTYETSGIGSPSIYSTAEITVKNAKLISTASEGIVIEGKNSVTIENVTLTDTNNKLNGNSTTYKNIFLYQSMSGDADDGVSEFTATNSNITTNKGDTFYITNTKSTITLENNTITNNDSDGNFLRAKSDSWGNSGSNGGTVTLSMNNQKATGNIVIDSVSTLDMTMKSSSTYTGTINNSNEAKSITLTLDKTSKIKLTGNSYITSLNNSDTTNSNIDFNGYKLYVNGESIN